MQITRIEGKGSDDRPFGAIVTDVDLNDLSGEAFGAIHRAFLDHGFLVFPAQFLDEEQSAAFGERFGPLEFGGASLTNRRRAEDGSRRGDGFDLDSQVMRTNIGNEAWHTDSSYKPISSKCAMLSAVIVPDEGGETELADTRAGYAALDQATRDRIEHLSAYHSNQYSQANDIGDFPPTDHTGPYRSAYHGEAYLRPLVKVHPETGVKNLFIGRHAFGIPGLGRDESRELLAHLLAVTVSDPGRTYLHRWQPGDTMIWDNRAVLHRARPYDYTQPRHLIGTRVAGDETELAYHPTDPQAEAGRWALAAELAILKLEATDRLYGATTASH